ncbi:MAG: 2Fe-2S iron-sulfur cluster-binding protein [Thalassobaculaceae bacterium]|nr:2Fe-2S iron-sulfur cluster-binding protein [Thalassobaculaceae bacterium]
MARFYPLTVTDIRRETRDAVVLTLAPRPEHRDAFAFTQGQYLTFRRSFEGEEIRRSYSICVARGADALQVGIKKVDGGWFSTWANDELTVGAELEAMAPMGTFHGPIEPDRAKRYLCFAGGSGITPVLGILRTVLAEEPQSSVTLVYGNRSSNTIMFREGLEDLKNRHLDRLSIVHVLESDAQEIDLFAGRIDGAKCAALFKHWIDVGRADQAFICGPEPMMLAVAAALKSHGMAGDRIKFELFASARPGRARRREATARNADKQEAICRATILLDGQKRVIEMPKHGMSVLDAGLGADLDIPYACKAGVCSTCRAMIVEGEAEMEANFALEDYEVRRGYVLTCQCYPLTDTITVDYGQ